MSNPISRKGADESQRRSIRSLAVSLPCACSFAIRSSPPPFFSACSSSRTSALRSLRREVTSRSRGSCVLSFAGGEPVLDVVHQLRRWSARAEQAANTLLLEALHVFLRDYAPACDQDVIPALVFHELRDARNQRHVRAAQNGKADDVGVFLDGCGSDHLRRLMQAGVNDLHPGVPERGGDYFRASIVPVQSGLGDDDSYWSHTGSKLTRFARYEQHFA